VSQRRITIVASELLGRAGTGGAGTADSLLGIALARHGHSVRLLIASGREIGTLSPWWMRRYDEANVEIRLLDRIERVRPSYLAPALEVFHALREDPPEVAIVNDWRGLGFLAQRARQTGVALVNTAFVVHCHSPGRVLTEFAQKVPDTLDRFGEHVMERVSIELADAVVSPSSWLLGWMRAHGWPVPHPASVIPYIRQSAALDETPERAPAGVRVRRLAFFGQLREGKGIRLFVETLAALPPDLLDGIEVVFLGTGRGRWASDRIAEALPPSVRDPRFETNLDREAALAELRVPGTLAVMPSLLDNSPNTVSECIEHGIPFISTEVGGIPEQVAEEDRARVLSRPTVSDLASALSTGLTSPTGVAPARPAREARESVDAWVDLVDAIVPASGRAARPATRIAVVARGDESLVRAQRLADSTRTAEVEVVVDDSRRSGLERTAADWVVFLDDDDRPDDELLDTCVSAQAASDADAVTVAVRPADDPNAVQLFLGDPGALGLVENLYGVLGLLRREVVAAQPMAEGPVDPDWALLARVALAGGRIVSLPDPLAGHAGRPGRAGDVPGEGLAVLQAFEERPVGDVDDLPQFAATLGAALAARPSTSPDGQTQPLMQRLRRRVALAVSTSRQRS
jgi:glycosyltransferase involved in cell wall biosynthesis